jgi:methylated-DNA-[protein]-cysteine S-methyltransferase
MSALASVWSSRLGDLSIELDAEGALTRLSFTPPSPSATALARLPDEHPVARALAAYFSGDLTAIDTLTVAPDGTPFQRRVWAALRTIPPGSTWSYAELAAAVGSVARAVGAANGANPVALVVPCHRVIGADGGLVGYGGGLPIKRWLLRHEGALLL